MTRAAWKCLYNTINFLKLETLYIPIKIFNRASIILPFLYNKNILIYTGKKFIPLLITSDMYYHKFGEFAPTRSIFSYVKKKKKKK